MVLFVQKGDIYGQIKRIQTRRTTPNPSW